MPYPNLSKNLWPAMERCVASVKAKGNVDNPYAVCYSSVTKNRQVKKIVSKVKSKK